MKLGLPQEPVPIQQVCLAPGMEPLRLIQLVAARLRAALLTFSLHFPALTSKVPLNFKLDTVDLQAITIFCSCKGFVWMHFGFTSSSDVSRFLFNSIARSTKTHPIRSMNIYTNTLVKYFKIKKTDVLRLFNNASQLPMNNLFC